MFLPEGLLDHFDIDGIADLCDIKSRAPYFRIYLTEKNIVPEGFPPEEYESKGFTEPKDVHDFPIRGRAVTYEMRRRRWRHKIRKNEIIVSDFSFVAQGAKFTQELADFLKGTD